MTANNRFLLLVVVQMKQYMCFLRNGATVTSVLLTGSRVQTNTERTLFCKLYAYRLENIKASSTVQLLFLIEMNKKWHFGAAIMQETRSHICNQALDAWKQENRKQMSCSSVLFALRTRNSQWFIWLTHLNETNITEQWWKWLPSHRVSSTSPWIMDEMLSLHKNLPSLSANAACLF